MRITFAYIFFLKRLVGENVFVSYVKSKLRLLYAYASNKGEKLKLSNNKNSIYVIYVVT